MAQAALENEPLLPTALTSWHEAKGARMVPFAGYAMPVQYPSGIIVEHKATREHAGLFDVSHMGQITLKGKNLSAQLEKLVPADVLGLEEFRTRYSQFTNEKGGILDDLMITRLPNEGDVEVLFLVVNAGTKLNDLAHLKKHLSGIEITYHETQALLAVQGPKAAQILSQFISPISEMVFMQAAFATFKGEQVFLTRSGYTGEDGYEVSVNATQAVALADALVQAGVTPVGLGARDTLRLEAGLCLYGHDMDETATPIEADLLWSIGKRRRTEGGFLGADVVLSHIQNGAPRKRVGVLPQGRAPIREGAQIADMDGNIIGTITSGTFSPILEAPIAMGLISKDFSTHGTQVQVLQRDKFSPATITKMPFVPHQYKR